MPDRQKEYFDLWESILELKEILPSDINAFYLSFPGSGNSNGFVVSKNPQNADPDRILISYNLKPNSGWALIISLNENDHWPVFENHFIPEGQFLFLKRYLPYVLLKLISYRLKSTQTIGHLAMSLDGKIATKEGHSQWIGNKKNQIHSHRMRALSDAILVGGNTFIKDNPQLNVRHVKGEDPIKIILGDGDYNFNKGSKDERIIWVNSIGDKPANIDIVTISRSDTGFNCKFLLTELFNKGIYIVYIEGGGVTLSGFINSKALDILQLHYAPILMGSGIPCITLPVISHVDKAISFSHYKIETIDEEWMFTGVLNYNS